MPNNRRARRYQAKLDRGVRFLNTPEAADYIGRHRSTLDKWRAENIVLPYYKDGPHIFYATEDLDAYLSSRRVEPVAYSHPRVTHNNEATA